MAEKSVRRGRQSVTEGREESEEIRGTQCEPVADTVSTNNA